LEAVEQSEPFIGGETGQPVVGGHGPNAPVSSFHVPPMQEKAGRHSGSGSVPKVQAGTAGEGRLHGAPAVGAWEGQPCGEPPVPLLATLETLEVPAPVPDACAVEPAPAPPGPEAEPAAWDETTPPQWMTKVHAATAKAKR
jgi:hypothetical protein